MVPSRSEDDRGNGIGSRVRAERKRRGLTVREFAQRLDVSPSLVSQIENGRVKPSVRTLYALSGELAISLDRMMFGDPMPFADRAAEVANGDVAAADLAGQPATDHVQRRDSRQRVLLESGVRWDRLTPRTVPGIEFLLLTYPPGSNSGAEAGLLRHTGRECGVVLQGTLEVTLGFDEYALGPGDSITFDSSTPHRFRNTGSDTVEAIWVVVGRQA